MEDAKKRIQELTSILRQANYDTKAVKTCIYAVFLVY